MTDNELKATAVAKLASHGVTVPENAPFRVLAHQIGLLVGSVVPWNQGLADYVRVWASPPKEPRYVAPFRPLTLGTHLRAAEIDRLPRPIGMPGIGNGGDSGMGRGR